MLLKNGLSSMADSMNDSREQMIERERKSQMDILHYNPHAKEDNRFNVLNDKLDRILSILEN